MARYAVAVIGATGAVGKTIVKVLEERSFPVRELRLGATARSSGQVLTFHGEPVKVQETKEELFRGIDLALFAGGDTSSEQYAWRIARNGTVVVDNSSTFRLDPRVPLVIPEINAHTLRDHQGVVANPNCSTIIMLLALVPLHRAAGVRRAVVATYQSVSGAGIAAMDALQEQLRALLPHPELLMNGASPEEIEAFAGTQSPIAFNLLFQWPIAEEGFTTEEWKMIRETQKIVGEAIPIAPTTVRVPSMVGHGIALTVELNRSLSPEEAKEILRQAEGVEVLDEPSTGRFPMPIYAAGRDPVYVGRIRRDPTVPAGLHLWVVGDNLRKGAALNAVQIAETMISMGLL
ncbi:MAG: aspartate-semialdehyde dehydrogenase [Armatimonadota bacterium]|nr:aspartate-semialdehyde dehydrogenase [Armatimonadota bacterium]MDR5703808.1 aspartate-semialdehyde dehydrogenase [Armatimonadota bacterium]MDR7434298.1 aspartate-semialdehyde dehydrogenase [Armatimonadota bacterium]